MQYAKMALKMLSTKLRSCDVGEADLFAAYFLSLRTKWHSLDSIRHYHGGIAMYNVLASNSNPKTQLFKDYGPFICNEYIAWLNIECALQSDALTLSSKEMQVNWPPFDVFLEHIIPFSNKRRPALHLASALLLWYYLRLLTSSIAPAVDAQHRSDFERHHIANVLVELSNSSSIPLHFKAFLKMPKQSRIKLFGDPETTNLRLSF